jgi:predicted ATPase
LGVRLLSLVGDNAVLSELVDQLVAVATEQDFPFWRSVGAVYRGWIQVQNGGVAEGISLLRSGMTAYRATGAAMWMPHFIALLAGAFEIAGD